MPAKQVIILDKQSPGRFKVALWADVPTARQPFYADTDKVSEWTGATVSDNDALKAGQVVERVITTALLPSAGIPEVKTALENQWADFQVDINSENPWNRYGTFWNGTSWTAGGVV